MTSSTRKALPALVALIPACLVLLASQPKQASVHPIHGDPMQNRSPLLEKQFLKLPLGNVRARGWLKTQLELQRDGLTGNAEELYYWLRLPSCGWLGGDGEDSWEKAPYYVKGLIPLAYTLDDEGLKRKVTKWVEWTFQSQNDEGWFGPASNGDWWPRMVVLYYLRDFYEATGDERVIPFFQKYFAYQSKHLPNRPLFDWGKDRGGDNLEIVLWLFNVTGDKGLLELAELIKSQTSNWTKYYSMKVPLPVRPDNRDPEIWWPNHIVNFNQGMKSPLLWYQMTGDESHRDAFMKATESGWHVTEYGRADGMVSGTEPLSDNSSTAGTELCAIVERILSNGFAMELGSVDATDQLEWVAFNALPATLSPDIKGLRYYSLINQVQSARGQSGFENCHGNNIVPGPHSGFWCCNNNFHFGWPKFTQQLWMATADGGLAAMAYSPSEVTAKVGKEAAEIRIVEDTEYPFRDSIKLTISLENPVVFPLKLRVPGWCANPVIKVNGKSRSGLKANSFHTIECEWKDGDVVELTFPMQMKSRRWVNDSISIERGPLLYALAPQHEVRTINRFANGFTEDEQLPTGAWNYALDLDPAKLDSVIKVEERPMPKQPFDPSSAPVVLKLPARQVTDWIVEQGAVRADEVPPSPVFTDQERESIALVPYGATEVRVTYFPLHSVDGTPYSKPLEQFAKASASHTWKGDSPNAMNDGIVAEKSNFGSVPRYTSWDRLGTQEWVQYEWDEPHGIDGVELLWYQDSGGCRVPRSWQVQYWDGKAWISVRNPSGYGMEIDGFNSTSFEAVETNKLRVVFESQPGFASGIIEWRVSSSD